MRLRADGQTVLQYFEQCRLTAYPDSGGIWTIGWGHTGPDVVEGLVITQARADELFADDVHDETADLDVLLKGFVLRTHQTDALTVLAYNIGTGAFAGSTIHKVLAVHGAGALVEDMWTRWDKATVKGKLVELAGLHTRRVIEWKLFNTPDTIPIVSADVQEWVDEQEKDETS